MAVVDFTPEERAFLCGPKAEAALAAAGVALEDLRPRAIETFEEPRELRASTFEKRRVYQWRLVRQELAKLEQRAAAAERKAAAAADNRPAAPAVKLPDYYVQGRSQSSGALPPQRSATSGQDDPESVGAAAQRAHELALRQMVQRETRALERELRAERQRERLEARQHAADEARQKAQSERERQRQASRESREFLSDVRAARRELEIRSGALSARDPRPRPASAPPERPGSAGASSARGGGSSSRAAGGGGGAPLAEAVRARAEAVQREKAAAIASKMSSKEQATQRRRDEVEAERAMKRLYAEQMRLRHEERLAGVQLQQLETTVRQQRELEERQAKAERERAAMRAAVGKITVGGGAGGGGGGGDGGDGGDGDGDGDALGPAASAARQAVREAELASKVAERAAAARERLAQAARQTESKAAMKDAKAEAYRRQSDEQREQERRALQVKNHELAIRRQQKLRARQVQDEVDRARAESAAELAARRSEEQQERLRAEREQKRLAQEVKLEAHRQNAERIQRAMAHRSAQTEASIANKDLRYEQRRQTADESKQLRQAYQVARYKQQASIHTKLRSAGSQGSLEAEARRAAEELGFELPPPLPPPPPAAPPTGDPASGSASLSRRSAAQQQQQQRPLAEPHQPSVTQAFGADRVSRERSGARGVDPEVASGGGGASALPPPRAPKTPAEREDSRTRAAFAAIERLRAEQNAELRHAVEAEQLAEAGRVELLAKTADGPDRVRLQKLLKLERDRADAELRGLTAEHELALAQQFKKLGVTR